MSVTETKTLFGTDSDSAIFLKGLPVPRVFSTENVEPLDSVACALQDAVIKNQNGIPLFEQKNVECPVSW